MEVSLIVLILLLCLFARLMTQKIPINWSSLLEIFNFVSFSYCHAGLTKVNDSSLKELPFEDDLQANPVCWSVDCVLLASHDK